MRGKPKRFGEITVDSDFTTAMLLVVLFIIVALILARDIRHILWSVPSQIAISGTLNRLGAALSLVYCLAFAFRFPNRLVRIGCALLAAHLSLALGSTYLHIFRDPRSALAFADSLMVQISLATFLIAIGHWVRKVVRWNPPSPAEREDR